MTNKNSKILFMCQSAVIAALYATLTFFVNAFGLANGAIQVRLSEALCILPVFTPAAVSGLFFGCIIANLLCASPVWDIVFGSLATLIGAYFTYRLRGCKHKTLCTIPPVLSNAIIIPFVLKLVYGFDGAYWYFFATVGLGELISCTVAGTLLYKLLYPHINKI